MPKLVPFIPEIRVIGGENLRWLEIACRPFFAAFMIARIEVSGCQSSSAVEQRTHKRQWGAFLAFLIDSIRIAL